MSLVRRTAPTFLLIVMTMALAACNGGGGEKFEWQPLFGDNSNDVTPVIAEVAGVEITQQDLDLRFDELPANMKSRYKGEEGRRLLLKDMIDQVLMARGAVELELYNERNVARTLISQRRSTLDLAMRGIGLLQDAEPTEDDLRTYFMNHRDRYRQLGMVMAQHIECPTEAEAQAAYERLMRGEFKDAFPYVVADYSVNKETKQRSGELGWFNRGGFVPYVKDSAAFSTIAYDLPDGINPPLRIGENWHVIEILRRQDERPMTFAEARAKVAEDMKPAFQDAIIDSYLAEARAAHPVQMFGEFAPGGGLSAEELFARGMAIGDPERRLDIFLLVHTDFPESDRADDALFMAAQAVLDRWQDRRTASRYLTMIREQYPDSDLIDDVDYLLKNMDNPNVLSPKSIDDLRR